MAVPYHLVAACGNVILAASGSNIHSFSAELQHLSTWRYPAKQQNGSGGLSSVPPTSPAPEEPPSKRRRVEDGEEEAANGNGRAAHSQTPEASSKKQGKGKNGNQEQGNVANERPFIHGLPTTTDGRYVVAITGLDKTIWVFEHDGAGNLKQLSQRMMPKRPCSVILTSDNQTILSADKFGDVYSLPLLLSPTDAINQKQSTTPIPNASRSATPSTTAPVATSQPFKPQANELTVHTKRNLKALENQRLGMQAKTASEKPAEALFEHTLLLGHVSMLTAVLAAPHPTTARPYIITADRDEHIRVSRGDPSQAHIIEAFCLGHEDFVSRLCVPASRPEILLSAGGDDDIFVWDWARGRLLARAGVLDRVRAVVPDAAKVAVSRLFAFSQPGPDGSVSVVVVCERVPALFFYELSENVLRHTATVPTPGNPLDVASLANSDSSPRLLLALDPKTTTGGEGGDSLFLLEWEAASGWQLSKSCKEMPVGENDSVKEEELQKALYATESLRKTTDFE